MMRTKEQACLDNIRMRLLTHYRMWLRQNAPVVHRNVDWAEVHTCAELADQLGVTEDQAWDCILDAASKMPE